MLPCYCSLKHGRDSVQLLALTYYLLRTPATRAIILQLNKEKARSEQTLQNSANQMARRIEQNSIRQELLRRIQETLEKHKT